MVTPELRRMFVPIISGRLSPGRTLSGRANPILLGSLHGLEASDKHHTRPQTIPAYTPGLVLGNSTGNHVPPRLGHPLTTRHLPVRPQKGVTPTGIEEPGATARHAVPRPSPDRKRRSPADLRTPHGSNPIRHEKLRLVTTAHHRAPPHKSMIVPKRRHPGRGRKHRSGIAHRATWCPWP